MSEVSLESAREKLNQFLETFPTAYGGYEAKLKQAVRNRYITKDEASLLWREFQKEWRIRAATRLYQEQCDYLRQLFDWQTNCLAFKGVPDYGKRG